MSMKLIAIVPAILSVTALDARRKADVVGSTALVGGGSGACGLGIFVGLPQQATFDDARNLFYQNCLDGAGGHPKELCQSGTIELFEGYDLKAAFAESPDSFFCKAVKNICEAHIRWTQAKIAQSLFLRRDNLTEAEEHQVAALKTESLDAATWGKKPSEPSSSVCYSFFQKCVAYIKQGRGGHIYCQNYCRKCRNYAKSKDSINRRNGIHCKKWNYQY